MHVAYHGSLLPSIYMNYFMLLFSIRIYKNLFRYFIYVHFDSTELSNDNFFLKKSMLSTYLSVSINTHIMFISQSMSSKVWCKNNFELSFLPNRKTKSPVANTTAIGNSIIKLTMVHRCNIIIEKHQWLTK